MKEQQQYELAWAAGFIDGEGHFGLHITKSKPTDKRVYGSPCLTVAQCDRRVLDKLQKILGAGKVGGPYEKDNKNWRSSYLLYINGYKKVKKVSDLLWPWLGIVKREQIEKVMVDYSEFTKRPKLKSGPKPRTTMCHPERTHFSKGLCASCYQLKWRQNAK